MTMKDQKTMMNNNDDEYGQLNVRGFLHALLLKPDIAGNQKKLSFSYAFFRKLDESDCH